MLDVRWGYPNGGIRSEEKDHLVFAVNDPFDYVNHEEEAPFAGELELTCG